MESQLQIVWWIATVGGVILFAAMSGLVALMYILTSPIWSSTRNRAAASAAVEETLADAGEVEEPDRRRRAAALAVAVACAEAERSPAFFVDESSHWRLLHRSLRLRRDTVGRPR